MDFRVSLKRLLRQSKVDTNAPIHDFCTESRDYFRSTTTTLATLSVVPGELANLQTLTLSIDKERKTHEARIEDQMDNLSTNSQALIKGTQDSLAVTQRLSDQVFRSVGMTESLAADVRKVIIVNRMVSQEDYCSNC